jgi:hypothetical protein
MPLSEGNPDTIHLEQFAFRLFGREHLVLFSRHMFIGLGTMEMCERWKVVILQLLGGERLLITCKSVRGSSCRIPARGETVADS